MSRLPRRIFRRVSPGLPSPPLTQSVSGDYGGVGLGTVQNVDFHYVLGPHRRDRVSINGAARYPSSKQGVSRFQVDSPSNRWTSPTA